MESNVFLHYPGQRRLVSRSALSPKENGPMPSFKLIIYSKDDCPLCDKLKEKLGAIMDRAGFTPSVLRGVELEVRDISKDRKWEAAYSMSIPVLAAASLDGSNEVRRRKTGMR